MLLSSFIAVLALQSPELPANLRALESRYSILIEVNRGPMSVSTPHGKVEGRPIDSASLARYAPRLASEFGRYPVELIRKTRLKRIVLCRDLAFAGQKRAAVPSFSERALYLDTDRAADDAKYQRHVIHHEFFHIIDWLDDGKLYRDDVWAALNPKGFRYGKGGVNLQNDSTVWALSDAQPGFLNKYSTAGVEEDKAEIFAYLLMNPRALTRRAAKDRVLRRKIDRMKKLMADYCPQLNERFWAAARK